jgi:histidinol-phosphate/aromatic aminotransferase/cobyric acid decarboxylase-like protein/imidazoleglycerol phosphate dehydratase HisB
MTIPPSLVQYQWPPSTAEIAARVGLPPSSILRFDGNVPPVPPASARPQAIAGALADINEYDRGRYFELRQAIANYHQLPLDYVVLGAGSDELIVLCARTFAANGAVATVPAISYSMYRFAAGMAGAEMVADPLSADLVYVCRPNNPTGELPDVPSVPGQLVIDEAYADYAQVDALEWIDRGAIVLRTFSKAFGLAGARVGYALALPPLAAVLSSRLAPLSVSSLSATLALAALASPPNVTEQIGERERLAGELRSRGLVALPSHTNFLYIPMDNPEDFVASLLPAGIVVRAFAGAVRISVRDEIDDNALLVALDAVRVGEVATDDLVRHRRITGETRMDVRLRLRGSGRVYVDTGSGLYDHFLTQLAFHSGIDLRIVGVGDHETGDHHTVEDLMRAFGDALNLALGERRGLVRYGEARVPMDEALAHAVVDLSGRPVSQLSISPDPGMATHGLESFAQTAKLTLHVTASGENAHHVAEGAFKAVGRALAMALQIDGNEIRSTKGSL